MGNCSAICCAKDDSHVIRQVNQEEIENAVNFNSNNKLGNSNQSARLTSALKPASSNKINHEKEGTNSAAGIEVGTSRRQNLPFGMK